MNPLTKTLLVTLVFGYDYSTKVTFRMTVPVNVFSMGSLKIQPPPGGDKDAIDMQNVIFDPRTDGMVEVFGSTVSHDLDDALEFLRRHPQVSDIQTIS